MEIEAKITGIKYTPFLCKELEETPIKNLGSMLSKKANFILKIDKTNKIAISWWVSPKRTRSYPYARVYDTLNFSGKKVTIIPIFKDEGKDGDRDFLQWDTISLMSLLGVYVIISYYNDAEPSKRYANKITNQKFNVYHIKREIKKLLNYQSDALHWNLEQIDNAGELAKRSLLSYKKISKKLKISMHSENSAEKKINILQQNKEIFKKASRDLAQKAQIRESMTVQPKEFLSGEKAILTIKNYLGGFYYFTADEARIKSNKIFLVEGKHSRHSLVPSLEDIKDGLIKMVLFTNLKNVTIDNRIYKPIPTLKLSSSKGFKYKKLNSEQKEIINLLKKEAKTNNFIIYG